MSCETSKQGETTVDTPEVIPGVGQVCMPSANKAPLYRRGAVEVMAARREIRKVSEVVCLLPFNPIVFPTVFPYDA